jgi:[ribosomal protein S18]-alanine N-acetyltransferase
MRIQTGTEPLIAAGTATDLAEVSAMERECYADPWPASAFAALPDNPRVFFAVARDLETEQLLGYAVAWYVLDEGELANLAVAPFARRRGVGRRLLDAILSDAVVRGTAQLYLEVRESNTAARELYRSKDFVEIGRRKEYYRKPKEDALILRRRVLPQP